MGKAQKLKEVANIWSSGSKVAGGSLSSQSVDDQKKQVEEISALQIELKAEAEMVWDRMKDIPEGIVICPGSEYELLVLTMPRSGENVREEAELTVIPHLRSLESHLPWKDLAELETSAATAFSAEDYLSTGVSKLIEKCACSKRFQAELRQALKELQHTQEILQTCNVRKRRAESEASDAKIAADERVAVAAEAQRKALTVQNEVRSHCELLDVACKALHDAKTLALEEDKGLEQARIDLRKAQDALVSAKTKLDQASLKKAQSDREVVNLEKHCSQLTEANKVLQSDLKRAEDNAIQGQKHAEKALKRSQSLGDTSIMHDEALAAATRDAQRKACRLAAYRHVTHLAPPSFQLEATEGSNQWYIDPSSLVFYYNVQLELKENILKLKQSDRQLSNLREAIRANLVYLLSQEPSQGPGVEQRLEKRIQVGFLSGLPKSSAGGSQIDIRISDDVLEPCDKLIPFLRLQLFPTTAGVDQPRIHIGSDRGCRVLKFHSTEFLSTGPRGVVKEARYCHRHVVVKIRSVSGAASHIARMRSDTIKTKLTAQFGSISTLCHPNVLQYFGFFIDDGKERPPCIGLVQDYCDGNLADLLACQHGHDADIELENRELVELFSELDVRGDGKVSQASFVRSIKDNPTLATKLGISPESLTSKGDLQFVWNYGDTNGGRGIEQQHKFGFIDHNMERMIDLKKLHSYFGKRDFWDGRIPWAMRLELVLGITRGMLYLASHGVVHGRLKSSNVAVGSGSSRQVAGGTWTLGRVAIMDYGEHFVDKIGALRLCSTGDEKAAWRAPELQEQLATGKAASCEGDVWGFGVIMWELWTGSVPVAHQIRMDVDSILADRQRPPEDEERLASEAPAPFLDAMVRCMSIPPRERPSFAQVLRSLMESRPNWLPEHLPG